MTDKGIPGQRKGSTPKLPTRQGHIANRSTSINRKGNPAKGGGGTGKKPPSSGCPPKATTAVLILAVSLGVTLKLMGVDV